MMPVLSKPAKGSNCFLFHFFLNIKPMQTNWLPAAEAAATLPSGQQVLLLNDERFLPSFDRYELGFVDEGEFRDADNLLTNRATHALPLDEMI